MSLLTGPGNIRVDQLDEQVWTLEEHASDNVRYIIPSPSEILKVKKNIKVGDHWLRYVNNERCVDCYIVGKWQDGGIGGAECHEERVSSIVIRWISVDYEKCEGKYRINGPAVVVERYVHEPQKTININSVEITEANTSKIDMSQLASVSDLKVPPSSPVVKPIIPITFTDVKGMTPKPSKPIVVVQSPPTKPKESGVTLADDYFMINDNWDQKN